MGHDADEGAFGRSSDLPPPCTAPARFLPPTLQALVRHASARPIQHSTETGSGASTLLFSHLSEDHTVFAMDCGTGSIQASSARRCCARETVTLRRGSDPAHAAAPHFRASPAAGADRRPAWLSVSGSRVLLPVSASGSGALLIVDDIHIPTITNLFDFLKADEMFDLQEVVETTAFFRRTARPDVPADRRRMVDPGLQLASVRQRGGELLVEPAGGARSTAALPRRSARAGHEPGRAGGSAGAPRRAAAARRLGAGRGRPPACAAVDLVLDGVRYRAAVKFPRPDVATAYGDEGYGRSGFDSRLPKAAVTPGPHELELRVVGADGPAVPALVLRFEAV